MSEEHEDADLIIMSSETNLSSFPKEAQSIKKENVITFWELKDYGENESNRNFQFVGMI